VAGPPTETLPDSPDLSGFGQVRGAGDLQRAASAAVLLGEVYLGEIGQHATGASASWAVMEAMGFDPVIAVGEFAARAPALDADLYYLVGGDPGVLAEVESWLRPLLPRLVEIVTRAVAWGVAPLAMTWDVAGASVVVERPGARPRRKTIAARPYFCGVEDLHPARTQVVHKGRELLALSHDGQDYRTDRAFLPIWDRQHGSWCGIGTRRLAYAAWKEELFVVLQRGRYLERSVDPPRVGRAPLGVVKIAGEDVPCTEVVSRGLAALRNGGATGLPSTTDEKGNPLWGIDVMQLPERSAVWERALDRTAARKLLACYTPPTNVMADAATHSGARTPQQVFSDATQHVANFTASVLTRVVATAVYYAWGADVAAPAVRAREIPTTKRKVLMDVFRTVAGLERKHGDGTYRLGDLVGPDLLKTLIGDGMVLSPADVTPAGGAAPEGQPRRESGGRGERRDNATTDEGEGDTGSGDGGAP